jgi:hypothetical protein
LVERPILSGPPDDLSGATPLRDHPATNHSGCQHETGEHGNAFARPSLNAHKRRKLELAAGATSRRGPTRSASHDYHVKPLRDQERAVVEQAERSYEILVAHWESRRPASRP